MKIKNVLFVPGKSAFSLMTRRLLKKVPGWTASSMRDSQSPVDLPRSGRRVNVFRLC